MKQLTKFFARTLIAVSVALTATFAFNLAFGITAIIFVIAAIILEGVKFLFVHTFSTSLENKEYDKATVIGLITTMLIGFSTYASFDALDKAVQNQNQVYKSEQSTYVQKVEQYKNDLVMYNNDFTYQNTLNSKISSIENQIQVQSNRPDRNAITDSRIATDRAQIESLKNERRELIVPQEPVTPKGGILPGFMAIIFAGLIELCSLTCNFFAARVKSSDSESEITTPLLLEPVTTLIPTVQKDIEQNDVQEQPVQPVQKPVVQKKSVQKSKVEKVEKVEFKSVKDSLNLTNAERVKLSRKLKSLDINWKEFNLNPDNIEIAKEYIL